MKFLVRALPISALLMPAFAFAQQFSKIDSTVKEVIQFLNNTVVPLIFAIAFLFFLWGVAQYFIIGRDAEEAKEKGKNYMLWGIAGFVVMVSVWGIVNLLASGLGFTDQEIQTIPNAPTTNR